MPSKNGKRSVDMIKEPPRKKRRFTRTPSTADQARHGDTWIWLIEVAAQAPEWFELTNQENEEKIALALYLDRKADFPLRELVNLYQNRRWRDMARRWCRSRVGRETLHICQWVGMIGLGIDDFFFSLFDAVLHTLSQLPADAVSNVSWNDWKQMSRRLTNEGKKREGELRQLFYPGHTVKKYINPSTERRSGFLAVLDDAAYWQMYDGILRAPGLRFMNINALITLSLREAKTLLQVMRHVVSWVDPKVEWAKAGKRDKDKLVLRKRLIPALKHFDVLSVKMCGTRLRAGIARVQERREAETASIILQQEVLEFVLDNLETFMAKKVVEYLKNGLDNPNGMESNGYARRFRHPTWAGVLNIVRW
ncbi:hypothetical protein MGU_08951 [Metarhizium guizhouense ARSEF 977]|uniref:Uncharacterized protein n=1 Tax=Metarhizium guizhouense (strain ARSEF 977) TaxID=1276136 RepID=A0A0B4GAE1_METGA|nr:hypothetical protein MGU_08951 [Metarhizium guizhouense ARSEF 977]